MCRFQRCAHCLQLDRPQSEVHAVFAGRVWRYFLCGSCTPTTQRDLLLVAEQVEANLLAQRGAIESSAAHSQAVH